MFYLSEVTNIFLKQKYFFGKKKFSPGPDLPGGLGEHLLRAEAVLDDEVRGERGLVRGEAPDAQVVHRADTSHRQEGRLAEQKGNKRKPLLWLSLI